MTITRHLFVSLFLFVLGVLLSYGHTAQAKVFSPETFTLKNGMQVVVVPNHRAPIVTHMVWYKVGSADEPEGKSGLAHFFEHLMFKGTPSYPNGTFSKLVSQNGGQENAFTSSDYTAYFQTVAVDRLELMMKLEADRMTNLALTKEVIEPERKVILEERRQRTDNNPRAILSEQMGASLYLNHPYRNPIIGWAHEIEGLTLEDLRSFYKKWYAPNNAILVVAGDISASQLKPLAEKYYGIIPANTTLAKQDRAKEPPHQIPRRLTFRDARVRQPVWSRQYLAPSLSSSDKTTPYALEILSEILGSGSKSRLYKELIIKSKVAVSAGASYSMGGKDHGRFSLYGGPTADYTLYEVEKAFDKQIDRLLSDGVTDQEVSEAKQRLVDSAIFARDSLRTGAQVLGAALAVGQTVEDVESWPYRIEKVTSEQVNAAAKAIFKSSQSVTGMLVPRTNGGKE